MQKNALSVRRRSTIFATPRPTRRTVFWPFRFRAGIFAGLIRRHVRIRH
jgi:hypothetical protein